jgi:hypothetical protein
MAGSAEWGERFFKIVRARNRPENEIRTADATDRPYRMLLSGQTAHVEAVSDQNPAYDRDRDDGHKAQRSGSNPRICGCANARPREEADFEAGFADRTQPTDAIVSRGRFVFGIHY